MTGYVYFASAAAVGVTKIGYSSYPLMRIAGFKNYCPCPIVIEIAVRGSYTEERALHDYLHNERSHGEWFRLSERTLGVMAALRSHGDVWAVVPPPQMIVGADCRKARLKLGLSMAALAALSGVNLDVVQHIETLSTPRSKSSYKSVIAAFKRLGVEVKLKPFKYEGASFKKMTTGQSLSSWLIEAGERRASTTIEKGRK